MLYSRNYAAQPKPVAAGPFEWVWEPFVDVLRHPLTVEAYNYWLHKRGTRLLPHVSDFNPVEVPRLLPYVLAIDVSGSPRAFRFSIIGEAHKDATGLNITGMTTEGLNEIDDGFRRQTEKFYHQICETKKACAAMGDLAWFDRSFCRFEAVHIPFSRQGEAVDRIIVIAAFDRMVPSP